MRLWQREPCRRGRCHPGVPLEGYVRESIVVSILGAQLTIGGAIVHSAYEASGDTDQFGVPMIFFGVVLGVLAAVRAYRAESPPRM